MRWAEINEDTRRLAVPSKTALKFWITNRGRVEIMDEGEHHYDYISNRDMGWHTPFQEGWVRGFYEQKRDLLCFDFDERKIKAPVCRTILKLLSDYNVSTIIVDDTRGGAFYGSQRFDPQSFKVYLRSLVN